MMITIGLGAEPVSAALHDRVRGESEVGGRAWHEPGPSRNHIHLWGFGYNFTSYKFKINIDA